DNTTPAMNKKFLFIGGGVLILFLVLIIVFASASRRKTTDVKTENLTPANTSNTKLNGVFTGSEGSNQIRSQFEKNNISTNDTKTIERSIPVTISTARIILDWIDKQKGNDGRYFYGLLCSSPTQCDKQIIDNRIALATTWARYTYYKQTNDPQDLTIIRKDLETLTNPQITEVIQNDFWNCKLMYDMYQSNIFNTTEKERIKQICLKSSNFPLDEMNVDDPNKVVPESNQANIDKVMRNQVISYDESKTNGEFSVYATAASDKAIKYLWHKNNLDLKAAQIYFNKALALYSNKKTEIGDQSSLLGIAAIDLYKVTNDNKYISLAHYMYKNTSQTMCTTSNGCVGVLFLSHDLNNLIKDVKYQNFAAQSRGYLIDNRFDHLPYAGYVSGKGAFYFQNNTTYTYSVRNNALLVGTLSQ
ncbi:MAG TPA: hypothetical protein VK338_03250, partial [Candidatus Nitrosocosmicus sp.]|nr:hypothetical protein [Candidatus Nitrosocosmicus sp.]